jgi:hypothetical protein
LLKNMLFLLSVVVVSPTVTYAIGASNDVTISGVVEAKNDFRNSNLATGRVARQQTFLVVRSIGNGTGKVPLIVEILNRPDSTRKGFQIGSNVTIRGVRRMLTAEDIAELERRFGNGSSSEDDQNVLSTVYRVISLLWRSGAVPAGLRPSHVSWIQVALAE